MKGCYMTDITFRSVNAYFIRFCALILDFASTFMA